MGIEDMEKKSDVAEVPPPNDGKVVAERNADETLRLVEEHGADFPPYSAEQTRKLRIKIQWRILLLICVIDLMLFIDKATLGYSAFLGIFQETGITDVDYNNLNTFFYVGYVIAQVPGHFLMQRFPLGKFVAVSILLWSVVIFLHCTATSYGGLIPLRFFLGFVESSLVPAMEMTMNMFLTPRESLSLQPMFWASCVGSPIPAGFIAYGLLFEKSSLLPWKYFMIITGGITLFLGTYCWFYYPDNPAKAKFLTLEEKINAIQHVHNATKSAIEQKTFKKYQLMEALKDPVTWLFLLAAFCLMLSNNLVYQQSLIFLQLGVGNLGSTLVSAAGGAFAVICSILATIGFKVWPNHSAFWSSFWCLPAIAGGIGMVTLHWNQRLSLLACQTLAANTFGNTYIIALGWTTASAAGYTKKLTRNVLWMAGYSIANIISPQLWANTTPPRYYGAWITQITVSWVGTPLCLWIIHWILSSRNKVRRAWIAEQEALGKRPTGYVEQRDESGVPIQVEVDISMLDLTDLENKYFIYEL